MEISMIGIKLKEKNDSWNNLDAYVADEMKTKYGSFEEYE